MRRSTRSQGGKLAGTLSSEQAKKAAAPSSSEESESEPEPDASESESESESEPEQQQQQRQRGGAPKADLLSSSEDEEDDAAWGSGDDSDGLGDADDSYADAAAAGSGVYESDSDDDEGDELPIERQARQLEADAAREAEEDAEEILQQEQALLAPESDDEELGEDERQTAVDEVPDLEELKSRIHETVRSLEGYRQLPEAKQAEVSRSEFRQMLVDDCAQYFGYLPFLIGKFLEIFPAPSQTVEFLEANEVDRPVTIRTNTLKTRRKDLQQALQSRGMRVEAMDKWSKVGLVVYQSPVPIGATPEYLAGHYIIQSAASFLPVMALLPEPGERVLDMCAAPGGKSAHLAALMKNSGVLFSNDLKRERLRALNANLHRLGAHNSVVTVRTAWPWSHTRVCSDFCACRRSPTTGGNIHRSCGASVPQTDRVSLATSPWQVG